MRFPFRVSWLCLLLAFPVSVLAATPATATATPQAVSVITLGDSAVPLRGPWRFTPGDSPVTAGAFAWAQPSFNDSAWASIDLTAASQSIDPAYGTNDYVPGLAAHGFSDLIGYAWYRLQIHLAQPGQAVAIKMSHHVDDAYQLYANGKLLGALGDFEPDGRVYAFRSRSLVFVLPPPDEQGNVTLALRFYLDPTTMLGGNTPDAGGMHEAPLVARPETAAAIANNEFRLSQHAFFFEGFLGVLALCLAFAAAYAWISSGFDSTYRWLTVAFTLGFVETLTVMLGMFSYTVYQQTALALLMALGVELVFWVLFWNDWFGFKRGRGLLLGLLGVAVVLAGIDLSGAVLFRNHMNQFAFTEFMEMTARGLRTVSSAVLLVLVGIGIRRNRVEGLLALPAVSLLVFSGYSSDLLTKFRIQTTLYPLGIRVGVGNLALLVMILTVGVLMQRRYFGNREVERLRQQTLASELEQARELQLRVLVPEEIHLPHLQVQAEYHPAQTVGGDFFQVIPQSGGALLIVVGDVSGKGISAAMLVAVLVGTIRTCAEQGAGPVQILEALNKRLLGRAGGHFATCVALRIEADGRAEFANAGHLPPYRNGQPLGFSGSLPLGLVADPGLELHHLTLTPGDYLTMLTDGVLEARAANGLLLGFERTSELSTQPANQIAQAAIAFGQDDDITVVTLAYQPVATGVLV